MVSLAINDQTKTEKVYLRKLSKVDISVRMLEIPVSVELRILVSCHGNEVQTSKFEIDPMIKVCIVPDDQDIANPSSRNRAIDRDVEDSS